MTEIQDSTNRFIKSAGLAGFLGLDPSSGKVVFVKFAVRMALPGRLACKVACSLHGEYPKAQIAKTVDDKLGDLSFGVFTSQTLDIACKLDRVFGLEFKRLNGDI